MEIVDLPSLACCGRIGDCAIGSSLNDASKKSTRRVTYLGVVCVLSPVVETLTLVGSTVVVLLSEIEVEPVPSVVEDWDEAEVPLVAEGPGIPTPPRMLRPIQ